MLGEIEAFEDKEKGYSLCHLDFDELSLETAYKCFKDL